MAIEVAPVRLTRSINWWKVGCIAALIAFEVAREFAVLSANAPVQVGTAVFVDKIGSKVFAEGRWRRIGGVDDLMPAAVRIECDIDRRECIEAVSVSLTPNSFGTPTISVYTPRIAGGAIFYTDSTPACVTYTTRIDLNLKQVFAVRQRKSSTPAGVHCEAMADRIEMTLGDGWRTPTQKPFVPILSVVTAILGLF